jgi:putative transposase
VWGLAVLAAAPIDWDGAIEVFRRVGRGMPRLAKVLADSAYRAAALAAWIEGHCRWQLETTGKRPGQVEFEPVRWRWIVERTFGWFGRYRRLSKDYEHNPKSSEAWIYIALIHRMSRFAHPDRNRDDDLLERPPKRPRT